MTKATAGQQLWLKGKKGRAAQRSREHQRRDKANKGVYFRAHQKGGTKRR